MPRGGPPGSRSDAVLSFRLHPLHTRSRKLRYPRQVRNMRPIVSISPGKGQRTCAEGGGNGDHDALGVAYAVAGETMRMTLGPPGALTTVSHDGRDVLLLGDCLSTAHAIPDRSLAFVYLDPPFATGRAQPYRAGLGSRESPLADRGGSGRWWLVWEPRIDAMLRALRPGGIFVLHLDPRTAPHARVALDAKIGPAHFLNEVVWHYRSGGVPRDRFAAKHDTLLVYRNGEGHTFRRLTQKRYLAHRAMRPGVEEFCDEEGWFRHVSMDDVWEIGHIAPDARERLGYPTQKPESLLERLLLAFTIEGDLVADLACGSGTLPAVARRLGRRWVAGDHDPRAIVCTVGRLARGIAPTLSDAWDRAGVDARRNDFAHRLDRWRSAPCEWGLVREEREALDAADARAPGIRIEWDEV
jgi:DNA modification methylase